MATSFADAQRAQKARQAVAGENDRLLKRADRRIDLKRFMNSDGKDKARAILITTCFTLFGMLPYVGMTLIWFLVYHDSFAQAVVCMVGLFVLGVMLLLGSLKRVMGKERVWVWWLGIVWSQAALVGLLVGFFLYFRSMAFYWKYEEMRTYTNVAAAQASDGFGDGSMFLFTSDTRLDHLRAVGFESKWTGQTYCVAPLVDSTMDQGSDISYWAVGINCCTSRAEFHCGDAKDGTTRSALRKLQPGEVARPWMQWAMEGDTYSKYMDAVHLQVASYYTRAARNPTLVLWSKDPVALRDSFYNNAKDVCIAVSLGYFALVSIGCYLIAWKLIPKQRPEGVIRDS